MDNSVVDVAPDNTNQVQQDIVSQQASERMIPQSQVNEIVGNAKREAAERAVDAYKRQNAQSAPQPQHYDAPNVRSSSEDDIKRFAGDEIKRHFGELEQQAQERANADAANRIVGMFKNKINAGKDKYEDFENVAGSVQMQFYPNVVQLLAEHVDNSADVLYHLAKNRDKLYRLEGLSGHNTSDAIYEIKRLADSIKDNAQSSQMKHANTPLSQQKPSNTGTESGALSMTDLKRKYKA